MKIKRLVGSGVFCCDCTVTSSTVRIGILIVNPALVREPKKIRLSNPDNSTNNEGYFVFLDKTSNSVSVELQRIKEEHG